MAGKTLTGIGEDESGRHELGADTSDSAIGARSLDRSVKAEKPDNPDKPLSARPTDRMPMYLPSSTPTVRTGAMAAVDEDKVAEGLKKLRSLDEPLGPIPTSTPTLKENLPSIGLPTPIHSTAGTPTLKEGIPVVGPPTPVNPAAIAAAAAAELIRSRGTAHGHALASAAGQGRLPVSVDDRMKGTLLGHDLHLPDLPALPPEEQRSAEIRPIARRETPTALVHEPRGADLDRGGDAPFSHGDSRFFDSQPPNDEYEPEHPRSKVMVRGAIFVAVVAVFVVAAVAWVRFHRAETPPPVEAHAAPAVAPPSAADNSGSPGLAPAAAPTEAQPTAAEPTAAPAPTEPAAVAPPPPPPVAAAPEADVTAAVAEPAPAPPARPKARRRDPGALPAPAPRPVVPAAPRVVARPVAPPHETKSPVPGKRTKDEDPDGTLPLTE
jgi:hypothetical protein